jgi:hypothetical protein
VVCHRGLLVPSLGTQAKVKTKPSHIRVSSNTVLEQSEDSDAMRCERDTNPNQDGTQSPSENQRVEEGAVVADVVAINGLLEPGE